MSEPQGKLNQNELVPWSLLHVAFRAVYVPALGADLGMKPPNISRLGSVKFVIGSKSEPKAQLTIPKSPSGVRQEAPLRGGIEDDYCRKLLHADYHNE